MTLIHRLLYAPNAADGLCRRCSWGTVRVGFFNGEAETFCRLVSPEARVRFAVRDCTDYCDRCVPVTASGGRRYGFVTEIKLESGAIRAIPGEATKPTSK